jgi:hypothetical protein
VREKNENHMNQHAHTTWLQIEAVASLRAHTHIAKFNTQEQLANAHSQQSEKEKEEMHADNEPFSIVHNPRMEVTQCTTLIYIYIYIILSNDALPSSQQINKSDRLLVLSFFSPLICTSKEKTSKIQSVHVNIYRCIPLHFW